MAYIYIVCPNCLSVNKLPKKDHYNKAKCGKCGFNLLDTHPIELDPNSFDIHIKRNDIPVVVDFWAPWCGPCQMMAPAFEEAAKNFPLKARFAKVNTEQFPQLAATYGIRGIPTMIIFKDGVEIDRVSGALNSAQITQWVGQYI
ncbi:thioredoxin TrxC [Nitrosophilus kaiyonis]|uniref:thioredoxin TrxC n=1 Tax=Nitrosophilus kaiyonis TaxID=2930200 RepID=UPI0024931BAD|nr:thioredoxin TrxC [Nitrosophilus kaiyonis]